MKKIFVSYSRNNADVVTKLVHDLQSAGINIWYDQTLTGGQRWWDDILANIRDCDLFIFALSPDSWDSEACKRELNYVGRLGKSIIPVLVSEGININLLSAPLNEIQVTDYRRCEKEAVFALVKAIYAAPPPPPLPDPLPDFPRVPVSYLSNLKERIDSTESLNAKDQITLLFELEEELHEGRSPTEIRDLLLRMKRRDDLLAKISTKIDVALKTLEDNTPIQHGENVSFQSLAQIQPVQQATDYGLSAGTKLCPQCNTKYKVEQRFCGTCGSSLAEPDNLKVAVPVTSPVTGDNAKKVMGTTSRRYLCTPTDATRLIDDVKGWLDSLGFDWQQISTDNQEQLIQIKKRGGWRNVIGMATSLNIGIHQAGDSLTVQIGAGKWIDKAVVGTVSMFVVWPLAITAGIGAWEQMKMPEKIFDYIGTRLIYK